MRAHDAVADEAAAPPQAASSEGAGHVGRGASGADDIDGGASLHSHERGSLVFGGARSTRELDTGSVEPIVAMSGVLGKYAVSRNGELFYAVEDEEDKAGGFGGGVSGLLHQSTSMRVRDELAQEGWIATAVTMTTVNFGLGSLALPSVAQTLGWAGFTIVNLVFGAGAILTGLLTRNMRLAHDSVRTYQGMTTPLYGARAYYTLLGFVVFGMWTICAGNVLTSGIALANITGGTLCMVACVAIGTLIPFAMTQMRALHAIRAASLLALVCILVPSLITLFYVPIDAGGQLGPNIRAFNASDGYAAVMVAVLNVVFAYSGSMLNFSYMVMMRKPADFNKVVYTSFGSLIALFEIIGVVIYLYLGDNAISPAIQNISNVPLRRVAFGIIFLHTVTVSSITGISIMQEVFPRVFGWHALLAFDWRSTLRYAGVSGALFVLTFIIVEVIPFFNEFLALASSTSNIMLGYGFAQFLWAELQRRRYRREGVKLTGGRVAWLTALYGMAAGAVVLSVAGFVAVVIEVNELYQSDAVGGAFSCDTTAYYLG